MLSWLVVILGKRKRLTEKFELQGCRRSRSSCVFPDITPFVSGCEFKASEQKLKVRAKESGKSKVRKGRRQKRRLKERFVRTVVGAVCLS